MSPSSAQWHSVSPHTRPLSIAILELAPTSVTLALTRSPPGNSPSPSGSANHHTPAQHVVHSLSHHQSHNHGHAGSSSHANNSGKKKKKKRGGASGGNLSVPHGADSEDGGDDGDDDSGGPHGFIPGAYPFSSMLADGQTFKDMLSHGVVITVDGMPWSRIVAHVSDDADDEDGLGAGANGDGEDDDADWEDDWEHAGNDEDETNVPGVATVARRRRGHRQSAGASDAHRPQGTRPTRSHAAHEKQPRWDREKAVVVVYDLDPSKEHEIELQIVGLVSEAKELVPVSNAILIPPVSPSNSTLHARSRANSLRSRSRPRSRSNSVNTAPPGPSPLGSSLLPEPPSSPGRTPPSGSDAHVVPTSILSPHDAQTAQTRHLIAAALAEREHFQLQIKEARKTAQRSEASLRTEIESLKKSNEKAGSNDQRNKQKYLALQEQVKQGWAAAETTNEEAAEIRNGLPELEAKLAVVNDEVEGVRGEWKTVKQLEEDAREADKKNRAEEDKKLADITAKIDKLRAKKEKKEAEKYELQKKLEDLERQREELDRRAEEERSMRRQGYYPGWHQPHPGPVPGDYGNQFDNRPLSNRPSLTNLNAGYTGPSFRPRGGFQHRFPSGGRPPPAAAPPGQFFPGGASSSTWNAPLPKAAVGGGSPALGRGPSGSGTNPAAVPFLPSTAGASPVASTAAADSALHTALMPPHLQHRIYLPNNVRPRPTPNFHPPPSVLAEQAAQAGAPASPVGGSGAKSPLSQPAFPPLPTTAPAVRPSPAGTGPSLASIVTRAVLAPTSQVLSQPGAPSPIGTGKPRTASTSSQKGSPVVAPPQQQQPGTAFPPLSPTAAPFTSPRTTPPVTTPPARGESA
ncbi:hypothetical protein Q8F55_005867 [Vanrija albida]|uniref:Uncharacterized protein n=1 Tax=Vanrija albida TaxID=181172 RepID=A0ABR3Q2S5_9TREE